MVEGPGLERKQATQAKSQGIDGNKRQRVQLKPVNLHQQGPLRYSRLLALRS